MRTRLSVGRSRRRATRRGLAASPTDTRCPHTALIFPLPSSLLAAAHHSILTLTPFPRLVHATQPNRLPHSLPNPAAASSSIAPPFPFPSFPTVQIPHSCDPWRPCGGSFAHIVPDLRFSLRYGGASPFRWAAHPWRPIPSTPSRSIFSTRLDRPHPYASLYLSYLSSW